MRSAMRRFKAAHARFHGFGRGARHELEWHAAQRWHSHAHHGRLGRPHDLGGASLGKRLLMTFIVASLLSIGLSAGALQYLLSRHLEASLVHGLGEQARWIADRVVLDAAGRPATLRHDAERDNIEGIAAQDWKYRVLDARGAVALSSDPGGAALAPAGVAFDGARTGFELVDAGVLLHATTLAVDRGGHRFFVQTAASERIARLVRGGLVGPLLKNALGIAAIALVLFAMGMHVTLSHLLWPLWHASAEAERIDPRNLAGRLATDFMPRELRPLVAAFNRALDRLERGYRTQQEFLAAAAHELKTPLALIRGQVELSDAPDRAALLGDIDRMARQVQQLLQLAEASEVGNYKFEPQDVGEVAGEAVDYLRRLADRGCVQLALSVPDAPVLRDADRGALFALAKNLVENAIQHSASGATVAITVEAGGFAVRNPGEPIPEEHLGQLFTRFWRGPARRDEGAGLGLSICHEVAQTHGWRIEPRNVDGGVEFRVRFDGR